MIRIPPRKYEPVRIIKKMLQVWDIFVVLRGKEKKNKTKIMKQNL